MKQGLELYKYFRYLGILLFLIFRKIIGIPYYFIVVWFRKYARNVVYNYVLQNKVYLKRLLERPIVIRDVCDITKGWSILPYHGASGGVINYRRISKLEYYLVFWLIWGWIDDDSNYDTFDMGYIKTIVNSERLKWMPKFILNRLSKVVAKENELQFGNSFDLGDARKPAFFFWASILWTIRNPAYNFKYMLHECNDPKLMFYHEFLGLAFGYDIDGRLIIGVR